MAIGGLRLIPVADKARKGGPPVLSMFKLAGLTVITATFCMELARDLGRVAVGVIPGLVLAIAIAFALIITFTFVVTSTRGM